MRVLLAYPPCTDPTAGYHSIPQLVPAVAGAGHEVMVRDLNLEAFDFLARPGPIEVLQARIAERVGTLERKHALSSGEQGEYLRLKIASRDPANLARVPEAVRTFRDPASFYSAERYLEAVSVASSWLEALSGLSHPLETRFAWVPGASGGLQIQRVRDLVDPVLGSRALAPFGPYLEQVLEPELDAFRPDVVGFSSTYQQQAIYGFALARWIRERWPGTRIVLGGRDANRIWKYLPAQQDLAPLFDVIDALFVGEGETAFPAWLDWAAGGRTALEAVPNLVHRDADLRVRAPASLHYEDLDRLRAPDYSGLPWERYWSPYPVVCYSPTRGCYWDRCTFCDHGLSRGRGGDAARERSVERVMADLEALRPRFRHVYFAVDAIRPRYLRRLSEAIAGAGLAWAAEVRPESTFTADFCRLLRDSGCVAVSVGLESGCQRTLDRMAKGTRVDLLRRTLRNLGASGIAVQIMGFTGFPGETYRDAEETIEFLRETTSDWSVAPLGSFFLRGWSPIARDPDGHGLEGVRRYENCDFTQNLFFERREAVLSPEEEASLEAAKASLLPPGLPPPLAAGIDSAHAILFFERFGRKCFETHFAGAPLRTRELELESPFDLVEIARNLERRERIASFLERLGRLVPYDLPLHTLGPVAAGAKAVYRLRSAPGPGSPTHSAEESCPCD